MSIQETVVVTVVASAFNTPRIKMNSVFLAGTHLHENMVCGSRVTVCLSTPSKGGLHGRNERVLGRGEPTVWASPPPQPPTPTRVWYPVTSCGGGLKETPPTGFQMWPSTFVK